MYTIIEIIKASLRKLSAYSAGDSLDPDVATDALNALSDLLDGWYSQGIINYASDVTDINLVAGTSSYTLSTKTFKVLNVLIQDSNDQDYPVREISELAYKGIVDKTTQSRPYKYFVQQVSDSSKTITVYPTPQTVETMKVTHKIRPMDCTSLYSSSSLPSELNNALIWNLAAELWSEYPNPDVQQIVFGKAEKALLAVVDAFGSETIETLSTDILCEGGYYNIDCDCYL